MMIAEPHKWALPFRDAGCDLYCFHYEAARACSNAASPDQHTTARSSPADLVKHVHRLGMRAGIAVKPRTGVDVLWEMLDGEEDARPDVRAFASPDSSIPPRFYQSIPCRTPPQH